MINFIILVSFIILQILDGIMTYYGIFHTKAGISYEANPLVLFYMQLMGVTITLLILKLSSIILGLVIYLFSTRFTFWSLLIITVYTSVFIVLHIISLTHFLNA